MTLCYENMSPAMVNVSLIQKEIVLNKIAWAGLKFIMTGKMIITFEKITLWTPNKYHIVPYGKTNHLI